MKQKINDFFKIFSGRPKDVGITESIKIIPFTLGWIISMGLMIYACKRNCLPVGLFALVFSWQTGWGMSIDRFFEKQKDNKRKV